MTTTTPTSEETAARLEAFTHRALVACALYGLGARSSSSARAQGLQVCFANLCTLIDDPFLELSSFVQAREKTGDDGLVALVVASTSAVGLARSSSMLRKSEREAHSRESGSHADDAFARAATWSLSATMGHHAPCVSPSRLRLLVDLAREAGLVLVEPDLPSPLRQTKAITNGRRPIDRAVASVIAYGATARPLLFVPERAAPKNGLVKLREERILDGWIAGRVSSSSSSSTPKTRSDSLFGAALDVLAEANAPMRGKDLLREARARRTTRGFPSSASDGPTLARDLVAAWIDNAIDAYAIDPALPITTPAP